MHQYSPLFISGFVGLQETEQRSFPVTIRHHLSSGNVSSVIRNLVLDLKKSNPNNYQLLSDRLVRDFGFHLDAIEFNEQKDEYVKAFYRENCEDRRLSLDFNSSGSGYMQILQILAPIYTVCPTSCKVVLLDEPDAHLHPNMQIALARSLKRIQKELNIQILISTHSPAIIKTAQPTEVIPISTSNLVSKPLTTETEVVESISQLDNYELAKSVISGKMVFIEDANTEIIEVFDKVADTKVFFGANTVSVHTGRGKDDKIPFLIKPLLKEFLGKDIEIYFIRDSDGIDNSWRDGLEEYAKKKDINLHLLERYEIENYILSPSLIRRALEKKYPLKELPSVEDIERNIVEYLRATVIMARYKYDDNLEDSIFKTAMLLSKQEYRNISTVKSEAENIRGTYENFTSFDNLIKIGMGKEALSLLFRWLNEDLKLNFCKEDIFDVLQLEDIPNEIIELLKQLHSEILTNTDIDLLPEFISDDAPADMDAQDLAIDEIVQLTIKL
nr:AAA family ATPase [Anaerofilum hominis]